MGSPGQLCGRGLLQGALRAGLPACGSEGSAQYGEVLGGQAHRSAEHGGDDPGKSIAIRGRTVSRVACPTLRRACLSVVTGIVGSALRMISS